MLGRCIQSIYDQIFFFVRAARHPFSESIQKTNVELGREADQSVSRSLFVEANYLPSSR